MELNKIMNQVIVLFLIMLIGYFTGKKRITTPEVNKGLTELILNITLPGMIISSFNYNYSREMLIQATTLFLISLIIHLSLIIISKPLYFKYSHNTKNVLRFITIFSNCGFMGYPVIESVYGKIGIFYAAIFNIPFNILIWIVGIILFSKDKKSIKKEIINPGIISVFIGLIIFVFSVKLPIPIYNTLTIIGSTTTPLSMIIIGSMLSDINLRNVIGGNEVYYGSVIRLILIPLSVLIILKGIGFKDLYLGIPVLIMAMPAAANTTIMAEKYGGDSSLASRCVFLTTMLSVITIPLIMYLI